MDRIKDLKRLINRTRIEDAKDQEGLKALVETAKCLDDAWSTN